MKILKQNEKEIRKEINKKNNIVFEIFGFYGYHIKILP